MDHVSACNNERPPENVPPPSYEEASDGLEPKFKEADQIPENIILIPGGNPNEICPKCHVGGLFTIQTDSIWECFWFLIIYFFSLGM